MAARRGIMDDQGKVLSMWRAPITILIVGTSIFFLAREIYFSTHGPKVSHKRHEEILTRWNYCRTNGIKWDWRKEL